MASEKTRRLARLLVPPPSWLDWEFSMIVFGRPISFLLVYAIEGFRAVTPNSITWAAFLCLLSASALLAAGGHEVLACLLLFARMVLDDTDGMLARFRGQTSRFGSYLDKVTDAVGFFVLFSVVGLRATASDGNPVWVVVSVAGAFSLLLMGYVKHVAKVEEHLARGLPPAAAPNASNAPRCPPPGEFAWKLLLHALVPMESDLLVYAIPFVLLERFDLLAIFYAATQVVGAAIQVISRGRTVRSLDAR